MQGIEPKFHNSLTERIEYYRFLLKENADDPDQSLEIISRSSELGELYDNYLANKKKLEKSIKEYRQFHDDLRRLLTSRLRELKRKSKQ